MISISNATANSTYGSVILKNHPKNEHLNGPARVTRTANLDGTVTINHGGVCDGDRTFKAFGTLDKTNTDILWYIYQNSTLVVVSAPDGCYMGVIEYLDLNGGNVDMTILIKERISA